MRAWGFWICDCRCHCTCHCTCHGTCHCTGHCTLGACLRICLNVLSPSPICAYLSLCLYVPMSVCRYVPMSLCLHVYIYLSAGPINQCAALFKCSSSTDTRSSRTDTRSVPRSSLMSCAGLGFRVSSLVRTLDPLLQHPTV